MPETIRVVAVNGSATVPSKTAALIDEILERLGTLVPIDPVVIDVGTLVPHFAGAYGDPDSPLAAALAEIAGADLLIAASPIYKGSYSGLFKHVFDLLDPGALTDTPVLLVATGGSERHTLALEHQFRPLFGFFQADTLPLAIYGHDSEFTSYRVTGEALGARIDKALTRAVPFLSADRRAESIFPVI